MTTLETSVRGALSSNVPSRALTMVRSSNSWTLPSPAQATPPVVSSSCIPPVPRRCADRYVVGELLGLGGMGLVYRARDLDAERDVAIKFMSSALSADAGLRRRFEREASITAAIDDPRVVSLYDSGIDGGIPFLVMELIEGTTLYQQLGMRGLSGNHLISLAGDIAAGLTAIHEAGFVHRDIKPSNIMVTPEGEAKIVDLGLAAPSGASERGFPSLAGATVPGAILGTVGYMSPEQARGEELRGTSDQFSFGVLLYEAATGRNPFARTSLAETIVAILHEEAPPVCAADPFNDVLRRCLAKRPEARFRSTRDLAVALGQVNLPAVDRSSAARLGSHR